MIDEKRIAEIEGRLAAATPGPWFVALKDCRHRPVRGYNTDICLKGDLCIIDPDDDCYPIVPIVSNKNGNGPFVNHETRQFIAHSRDDIPYLLDLVKSLREELTRERTKSRDMERMRR